MNSFILQPSIPADERQLIVSAVHAASLISRLDSEVWPDDDLNKSLTTTLSKPSPSIIAVGDDAWLDQVITSTLKLTKSNDSIPVFGQLLVPRSAIKLFTKYSIKRSVDSAISSLAARKLSPLQAYRAGNLIFTQCLTMRQSPSSSGVLQIKIEAPEGGQLEITTSATNISVFGLESLDQTSPSSLQLHVQSNRALSSHSQSDPLLPISDKHSTNRHLEEVLHAVAKSISISSSKPLEVLSHQQVLSSNHLSIELLPYKLRFITPKNQPHRY